MAAKLAFAGARGFDPLTAAIAKLRAGTAATRATAIAHAIHGAIGISEEFDLQLYSRRLIDYRLASGTEHDWALELGRQRLAHPANETLDFLRDLFPAATAG